MHIFNNAVRIISLIIASLFFIACSTTNLLYTDAVNLRSDKEISIHFIDVGGGDSILINLPDGSNMLVDAGSSDAGPGLVKYLKSIGVQRIDHLILTHPHDDHVGGAFNIRTEFEVGNIYDNGFDNDSSILHGCYLTFFRGDLSRYRVLQAGEQFLFGRVKIDVINPLIPPTGNLNDDSIVLRLYYGDIRVLLVGDMGKVGERRLLNTGTELKSHVIKVGHHGADNASSEEFLAAVGPEAAVITVGADNEFALPGRTILNSLKEAGIKVYRTDLNGHIVLKTDGRVFSLNTEKALNGERK